MWRVKIIFVKNPPPVNFGKVGGALFLLVKNTSMVLGYMFFVGGSMRGGSFPEHSQKGEEDEVRILV